MVFTFGNYGGKSLYFSRIKTGICLDGKIEKIRPSFLSTSFSDGCLVEATFVEIRFSDLIGSNQGFDLIKPDTERAKLRWKSENRILRDFQF